MDTAAPSTTKADLVKALTAAIIDKPPYCSGTCALPSNAQLLVYKTSNGPKCIEWSQPPDEPELTSLAEACLPASFGLDNKDIYDESYRKALKMDRPNFATNFNPEETGLISVVHGQLLQGLDTQKRIRPELYKLNVYGKGSFFKSHKDTPRGDSMFASLVVVFPTIHEGGTLLLRHGDKEWAFDSAKELSDKTSEPLIGYVAFYSDVNHEVITVTSGYRVTLTYNLYLESNQASLPANINYFAPDEQFFEFALRNALGHPEFMPKGGLMGFGMRFMYPVELGTKLDTLMDSLKGSDAMVARVCKRLGMNISLKVVCNKGPGYLETVMVDRIVDERKLDMQDSESGSLTADLCDSHNGRVIKQPPTAEPDWVRCSEDGDEDDPMFAQIDEETKARLKASSQCRIRSTIGKPCFSWTHTDYFKPKEDDLASEGSDILWITPVTRLASVESPYMHYGNESELSFIYEYVCLIAEVGPAEQRLATGGRDSKRKHDSTG